MGHAAVHGLFPYIASIAIPSGYSLWEYLYSVSSFEICSRRGYNRARDQPPEKCSGSKKKRGARRRRWKNCVSDEL